MTPPTKSSTRISKQPRLSEAARHVVVPEGIVSTGWPAVRDTLANLDITFDQWQQDLTKVALGKRRDGTYAAGVGGVVLSIPRQVGKTFLVGSLVFALSLLRDGIKTVWTAQHTNTADETFEAMQDLCSLPKFKPHVKRILTGGGKQLIDFQNGSRIEFGARESGFGRGKSKVSILVLDEFQHVKESALENLTPTQNQGDNPLLFMMGTPPRPVDNGEAFKNKRKRALSGRSKDVLFVEMSADRDAKIDDRKQWAKANPSFPRRTPVDAILRMRENLESEDSFRREALGIWDEEFTGKSLISADQWRMLYVPDVEVVPDRRVVGVKFSVDGSLVGLSLGVRPVEGPVHVSGIRLASKAEGIQWIVDWCSERRDVINQIVVDGRGDDMVLSEALVEAGFRSASKAKKASSHFIRIPSPLDYASAHAAFLAGVTAEDLSHGDSPLLDEQVAGSMRRDVGKSGGWGWQAIRDTDNTTLLDSATLAWWGAKTCTRKPVGHKQKVGW